MMKMDAMKKNEHWREQDRAGRIAKAPFCKSERTVRTFTPVSIEVESTVVSLGTTLVEDAPVAVMKSNST